MDWYRTFFLTLLLLTAAQPSHAMRSVRDCRGNLIAEAGPNKDLDRPLLSFPGTTGFRIDAFAAASSQLDKLPAAVNRGYLIAKKRYIAFYGHAAVSFIRKSQEKLDAVRTYYFNVVRDGETDPAAFFMLSQGFHLDETQAPLPADEAFSKVDLRNRPDGFQSNHVYEGIRFATRPGEPQSTFHNIPLGMARFIAEQFGGAAQIPDDTLVYIWTIVSKLKEHYTANGFTPSLSEEILQNPWHHLLEMRKADLLKLLSEAR